LYSTLLCTQYLCSPVGIAGGTGASSGSGGVNHQCLPLDPEFAKYKENALDVTYIKMVEYESQDYGIFNSNVDDNQVSTRWAGETFLCSYCLSVVEHKSTYSCGAIEGRLGHALVCWLRMGWQSVIS